MTPSSWSKRLWTWKSRPLCLRPSPKTMKSSLGLVEALFRVTVREIIKENATYILTCRCSMELSVSGAAQHLLGTIPSGLPDGREEVGCSCQEQPARVSMNDGTEARKQNLAKEHRRSSDSSKMASALHITISIGCAHACTKLSLYT